MIDVRYHIYSLAAVFFALTIGIVIGTSFARNSPATGRERQTIQRYANSMLIFKRGIEKANEEAARKTELAKNKEDFCRAVLPIVVKDKLAWRNVAIVQTGDYDDLAGAIKRALELAGARVTSITDMSRSFPYDDDNKIARVLDYCGITPPTDGKAARDKLFAILSGAIHGSSYMRLISKLEQAGVARFTGDYDRWNRMIVLVGGASSENANTAQSLDTQLIVQFQKPGATVVGCETADAVVSYTPTWHKMGIATVDNADSAIGQIDLICALNGEMALFGIKDNAERLIPQTLESD